LFGKYTVTLKLYPAVVTLHLLGALVLLGLLVLQREFFLDGQVPRVRVARAAVGGVLALLVLQMALGGWVSSNYAVLACQGFPTCNGQWWPPMDAGHGFTLLRELGRAGHGGFLPFEALVAIHMAHRLVAVLAVAGATLLVLRLRREGSVPARRYARALLWLLVAQVASGLSNVVLDWPIVAALAHSAGAAALVGLLVSLWARALPALQALSLSPAGPGRAA